MDSKPNNFLKKDSIPLRLVSDGEFFIYHGAVYQKTKVSETLLEYVGDRGPNVIIAHRLHSGDFRPLFSEFEVVVVRLHIALSYPGVNLHKTAAHFIN